MSFNILLLLLLYYLVKALDICCKMERKDKQTENKRIKIV